MQTPVSPFIDEKGFLLLDGGLATELEKKGFDLNHHLWSARILVSHPEAIRDVHLSYLEAGADCIISSSYQASIRGFMSAGHTKQNAKQLITESVSLAMEARDIYLQNHTRSTRPLVAASVGPYGAFLADGSEYTGNYSISDEELYEFHIERFQILSESGADLMACETIPSFQEARILKRIFNELEVTGWISFSCSNPETINDGVSIKECAILLDDCPFIIATGVNCTPPEYVSTIVKTFKSNSSKIVLAYPNSGESYHPGDKTWKGVSDKDAFCEMAQLWVDSGAQIIGGCCKTTPAFIYAIGKNLESADL